MEKYVNFEDSLFILSAKIRLIRDMLRLKPDTGLFLEQTLTDLESIDKALESLTKNLFENTRFLDRELEFDNVSDIEWQFGHLLVEFIEGDSPFSAANVPAIQDRILPLLDHSAVRRKVITETVVPADQAQTEPVVSSLELSELLQKF